MDLAVVNPMKCKFCGDESPLIQAHIIPAVFFRRIRRGPQALEMIANTPGEYLKKSPVGVYDRNIVCRKCELIWQEWDDYAQKLLGEEPLNGRAQYHGKRKICYVVENFDYEKLKLFFISLAWRASVSTQPFFSKVSLGEFQDTAKQYIENCDPGGSEDFSITLAKFDHPLAKTILDPHSEKILGVNYLRFYLANYVAYIKVDRMSTPMPFAQFSMTKGRPLYIFCRDFMKSKELNLIRMMLTGN